MRLMTPLTERMRLHHSQNHIHGGSGQVPVTLMLLKEYSDHITSQSRLINNRAI